MVKQLLTLISTSVIFLFVLAIPASAQVIVSEVLPNPGGGLSRAEWIELTNLGEDPVSLQNWQLRGKQIAEEIYLPPGGYAVFTKDIDQFWQRYSDTAEGISLYELGITLSNSSTIVDLVDDQGVEIDAFSYTGSERDRSWERLQDTELDPLQHCYYHTVGMENDNWLQVDEPICPQIQFATSDLPWTDQLEVLGPELVSFKLDTAAEFDDVTWQIAGESFSVESPQTVLHSWQGAIGVEASLLGNSFTFSSAELTVWPEIYCNEIMPDQSWVELSTQHPGPTNLAGWYLLNAEGEKYTISGSLEAEQYLVVDLPVGFVSADADQLILHTPTDFAVDALSFSAIESGKSLSLNEDGTWVVTYPPTKGESNVDQDLWQEHTIMITEVFPSPDSGENEWVELYNWGSETLDLSQVVIADAASSTGISGMIEPNAHLVWSASGITLNNGGDDLTLLDQAGNVLDTFSYESTKRSWAAVRWWDAQASEYGSKVFLTDKPSPGQYNLQSLETEDAAAVEAEDTTSVRTGSGEGGVLGSSVPPTWEYSDPSLSPTLFVPRRLQKGGTRLPVWWVTLGVLAPILLAYLWRHKEKFQTLFAGLDKKITAFQSRPSIVPTAAQATALGQQ